MSSVVHPPHRWGLSGIWPRLDLGARLQSCAQTGRDTRSGAGTHSTAADDDGEDGKMVIHKERLMLVLVLAAARAAPGRAVHSRAYYT